ncbi:hypothetical protein KEJ45_06295 [Candidatus Bathyarchaeota archaeon]|nr:hypothetical protein [Candidatus Bathyarchaeota archaeon]
MKKTKYLFAITTFALILTALSSTFAYAQITPPETVNIYAWTDKTNYAPGEKGTLTIVIRNDRTDEDLILYNITIIYPWFAYTGDKWEGNDTITVGESLLKNGGVKTYTKEFTVPNDGRALSSPFGYSQISIVATVNTYPYEYSETAYFYVKSTPLYITIEDWDKAVTLFTIQVILIIVCTIIIAATVFLSSRRPKVMWREEEKTE